MSSFSFDIGQKVRPIAGELASGDVALVARTRAGVISALIDGLGHGKSAAEAANACARCIEDHREIDLDEMFSLAHRTLRSGRGVVVAVARFDIDRREVELASIGNISTTVIHAIRGAGLSKVSPLTVPGVLGSAFRKVRVQKLPFADGDALLMYSDGVRSRFDPASLRAPSAQEVADEVISTYGKDSDDAGCVFIRGVSTRSGEQTLTRTGEPPSTPKIATLSAQSSPSGMSREPSGGLDSSDVVHRTIPLRVEGDAQLVALETRRLGAEIGLPTRAQWEAGIAAAELASLAMKHGVDGVLNLRKTRAPEVALVIEVIDRSGALRVLARALQDNGVIGAQPGISTPRADSGLGNALRWMDDIDVKIDAGVGSRIVARKRLVFSVVEGAGVTR